MHARRRRAFEKGTGAKKRCFSWYPALQLEISAAAPRRLAAVHMPRVTRCACALQRDPLSVAQGLLRVSTLLRALSARANRHGDHQDMHGLAMTVHRYEGVAYGDQRTLQRRTPAAAGGRDPYAIAPVVAMGVPHTCQQ